MHRSWWLNRILPKVEIKILLRSTRCASRAGGTFPRLILGIGIRALIPVEAAHELPSPPFLFRRGFGRINLPQNSSDLPATQLPARWCFPHRRFGFGVHDSHCTHVRGLAVKMKYSKQPCSGGSGGCVLGVIPRAGDSLFDHVAKRGDVLELAAEVGPVRVVQVEPWVSVGEINLRQCCTQSSGAATEGKKRQDRGVAWKRGRGILTADYADFRGWGRGINTADPPSPGLRRAGARKTRRKTRHKAEGEILTAD
jgi:hypothetical protein